MQTIQNKNQSAHTRAELTVINFKGNIHQVESFCGKTKLHVFHSLKYATFDLYSIKMKPSLIKWEILYPPLVDRTTQFLFP